MKTRTNTIVNVLPSFNFLRSSVIALIGASKIAPKTNKIAPNIAPDDTATSAITPNHITAHQRTMFTTDFIFFCSFLF
jgi:hypothetical protein